MRTPVNGQNDDPVDLRIADDRSDLEPDLIDVIFLKAHMKWKIPAVPCHELPHNIRKSCLHAAADQEKLPPLSNSPVTNIDAQHFIDVDVLSAHCHHFLGFVGIFSVSSIDRTADNFGAILAITSPSNT